MSSETSNLSSHAPQAQLVIACHEADWNEAHSIITEYAPLNWESLKQIYLLEVATRVKLREKAVGPERYIEQDPNKLRRALNAIAPPEEAARVIVLGNTILPVGKPPEDLRAVTPIRSVADLQKSLPRILAQSGLDWMSHTASLLAHYHDIGVNRNGIAAWREQFDRCRAGWIGDALLKLLDFWTSSCVCDALFQVPDKPSPPSETDTLNWLTSYDCISFNQTDTGDSAAIICRFAKKRIGELLLKKRVVLQKYIEEAKTSSRILFLEDCLLTGTEIRRLFESISFNQLASHDIDLRFAVGTTYGQQRLQAYLDEKNLPRVRILEPPRGFIPNLSEAGLDAAQKGLLLDTNSELANPSAYLLNGIQLRARPHFNKSQRKNIVTFCEALGEPLMRTHLRRKGWTDEQINGVMPAWALGPSGLGLLLGFAHGIPKPALPLFWLGGEFDVRLFEHRFQGVWQPLFSRRVGDAAERSEH